VAPGLAFQGWAQPCGNVSVRRLKAQGKV
jgi:hypothetical protein